MVPAVGLRFRVQRVGVGGSPGWPQWPSCVAAADVAPAGWAAPAAQPGSPRPPALPVLPAAEPTPASPPGSASAPSADATGEAARPPLPPRPRLRGKQPPPQGSAYEAGAVDDRQGGHAGGPSGGEDTCCNYSKVLNYYAVYDAMRRTFEKQWCSRRSELGAMPQKLGRNERGGCRSAFAKLDVVQRVELCERALTQPGLARRLVADLQRHQRNLQRRIHLASEKGRPGQPQNFEVRGTYVLMTYLGGRFNLPGSEPVALPGGCIGALVEALRRSQSVQKLVEDCKKFIHELTQRLQVSRFAWALEVCPRTYATEGKVRAHLHVALCRYPEFRVQLQHFAFGHLMPMCSRCNPAQRDKRSSGAASILFYCQIDKIGQLHNGGSHEPFHDYHINPEWITNLLQAGNITESSARQMYVQGCKNVVHHLQNLERVVAERRQVALQERMALVQTSCAARMQAFKDVPLVRERFLPHFQSIKPRYPFLVLEGPSRTGKTSYAKHITGDPAEVFEVNCASCPEPDLRDFDSNMHKAVLFDEASPELVLTQRRLFQSPSCLLDLGCSTTNCHKYQVFVSGIMMIVCSNTWSSQVQQLEHAGDAEWLYSNSIVVHVGEPLWVGSEQAG